MFFLILILLLVSIGIGVVDGIMVTVEIRLFVQLRIPTDEPAHLGIIVARAHMAQTRIPIVSIPTHRRVHVGIGAAPRTRHLIAETVERQGSCHCLAAVGDRALAALSIEERRFAIFSYQRVAMCIRRSRCASLLFKQDLAAIVEEVGGCPACGAADAPSCGIIRETHDATALRDGADLPVISIGERVGGSAQRAACLLAIGIVRIAVDEAARTAACGRQFVVAIQRERRGCRAFRLAGAVAHAVQGIRNAVRVASGAAFADKTAAPIITPRYHIAACFRAGMSAIISIVNIAEAGERCRATVLVDNGDKLASIVVTFRDGRAIRVGNTRFLA